MTFFIRILKEVTGSLFLILVQILDMKVGVNDEKLGSFVCFPYFMHWVHLLCVNIFIVKNLHFKYFEIIISSK